MTSKPIKPLARLLEYSPKYRNLIYQASACSILNKVFDLAPPVLIGTAIDIVIKKENSALASIFGLASVSQQLITLTIISVIIWSLESIFEYAYERLWRNLAQNIQHDLRLDGYRHIQNLELEYFENRSTGRLMSVLNDDINQLERFLDVGANEILQVITTIVIIGLAFIFLTPTTAWMAIVPIPVIVWGAVAYQKFLEPLYANVREKVSLLNSRLSNNLSGITTIKSFTTEEYEIERVTADSEAYRRSNQKAIAYSAAFVPLIRFVILAGFTSILLFGGLQVEAGTLEVGIYSVLVFMTQRLLWPLTRLGQTLDLYQRAMASTIRVMELLDTPISIHSGEIPLALTITKGKIHFKDVSFAYQEREAVLENLNLHIPAGKTTAIVGSTGSGKSTIVKLLLRLYEIHQGVITLDGVNIQDIVLYDLRKAIGLVSQDVFLFHGSVRENIAYGNPNATERDVMGAAQVAEAHQFIMELPQGYDTIVGERGQKLSGGQRQRLSIARAVLKNPPILILDEATSAVDNETEAAIARSLQRITEGRTTIMIAHRLSTIRHAHCIYVVERGKIVESGTHDDLISKHGVYQGLWQVQTGVAVGVKS